MNMENIQDKIEKIKKEAPQFYCLQEYSVPFGEREDRLCLEGLENDIYLVRNYRTLSSTGIVAPTMGLRVTDLTQCALLFTISKEKNEEIKSSLIEENTLLRCLYRRIYNTLDLNSLECSSYIKYFKCIVNTKEIKEQCSLINKIPKENLIFLPKFSIELLLPLLYE